MTTKVNKWIANLFHPDDLDDTVATLADSDEADDTAESQDVALRRRISQAEATIGRLWRGLDSG